MKRRVLLFLSLSLCVSLGALIGAPLTAYGATANLPITSTLSVISPDGSKNFDVSDNGDNSWQGLYNSASNLVYGGTARCDSTTLSHLDSNISNSYPRVVSQHIWSTSQPQPYLNKSSLIPYGWSSGDATSVIIWWDTDPVKGELNIDSIGGSGEHVASISDVDNNSSRLEYLMLTISNSGTYYRTCGVVSSASGVIFDCCSFVAGNFTGWNSNQSTNQGYIFYSTLTLESGWEDDIPSSPSSVIPDSSWVPNWHYSIGNDYKVTFNDLNFYTVDNVPFLCDDDLVPVIDMEVYKTGNATPEDSGTFSASSEIYFQAQKLSTDQQYTVTGIYRCGDSPVFSDYGTSSFTITSVGTLQHPDLFGDCIDSDFPWFHPDVCLQNVFTVVNLLTFGNLSAFPNLGYVVECKNLTHIASWLSLSNGYQVCPAFPSYVRNVTTPFVTFALGLLTARFFTKRSSA